MKTNPRSGLTDEQLVYLRAKLMRAQRMTLARTRRHVPVSDGDPLEQGAPPGDAADLAEQTLELETNAGLTESDHQRLKDIDDALRRMDAGTYGFCEGSGVPLGFDRLSVEPWARYTTAYQEKLEVETRPNRPPTL